MLRRISGVAHALHPGKGDQGHASDDSGVIAATNWNIRGLSGSLEGVLGVPVTDETGLEGKYDWNLQFTPGDRRSLIEAVKEELGLELRTDVRTIEYLIVEKRR